MDVNTDINLLYGLPYPWNLSWYPPENMNLGSRDGGVGMSVRRTTCLHIDNLLEPRNNAKWKELSPTTGDRIALLLTVILDEAKRSPHRIIAGTGDRTIAAR